jgi:hypothetical protein
LQDTFASLMWMCSSCLLAGPLSALRCAHHVAAAAVVGHIRSHEQLLVLLLLMLRHAAAVRL